MSLVVKVSINDIHVTHVAVASKVADGAGTYAPNTYMVHLRDIKAGKQLIEGKIIMHNPDDGALELARKVLNLTNGCQHGGEVSLKFDGGRGAVICNQCRHVLGYSRQFLATMMHSNADEIDIDPEDSDDSAN